MASSDIFTELRSIQELLASGVPAPTAAPINPLPQVAGLVVAGLPAANSDSEEEEEEEQAVPPRHRAVHTHRPQPVAQVRELEHTVKALRQQQAENEDKCRRLEAALEAAQQDGALVAARLRGELAGKQEECGQLATMILQQREEIEGLQARLQHTSQQAEEGRKATLSSIQQLQEAAAEWRRQGEDGLEALAAERGRSSNLQNEAQHLLMQVKGLQAQVGDERRQREAAAAELTALRATVGGPAGGGTSLVAELRQCLATERSWRKAVVQWLRGEVQTHVEQERVLLNVGTAVRCGPGEPAFGEGRARLGQQVAATPALPPRHVPAIQLAPDATVHVAAVPDSSSDKVTLHGPRAQAVSMSSAIALNNATGSDRGKAGGTSGGSCSSGAADWRQHFQATMRAFDERHGRLQQELSSLQRKALQMAV